MTVRLDQDEHYCSCNVQPFTYKTHPLDSLQNLLYIRKLQLLLLLPCHSPFSGFAYQQAGSRAQKIETNMSAVCAHPNISSINSKQSDSIATLSSSSRRKRASTSRGRSCGSILQTYITAKQRCPGTIHCCLEQEVLPISSCSGNFFSINAFLGASLLLSNLRKEGWD